MASDITSYKGSRLLEPATPGSNNDGFEYTSPAQGSLIIFEIETIKKENENNIKRYKKVLPHILKYFLI
jgi:hypothetical protein